MKIIKADVVDSHTVIKTGAVERYFKKSFIILKFLIVLEKI
jgi:hypothetical protein